MWHNINVLNIYTILHNKKYMNDILPNPKWGSLTRVRTINTVIDMSKICQSRGWTGEHLSFPGEIKYTKTINTVLLHMYVLHFALFDSFLASIILGDQPQFSARCGWLGSVRELLFLLASCMPDL